MISHEIRKSTTRHAATAKLLKDYVGSSIGPRGMYKIVTEEGSLWVGKGKEMLERLNAQDPVARIIIEAACDVDSFVRDGSLVFTLIVCTLLEGVEELVKKGIHPSIIVRGQNLASNFIAQRPFNELFEISKARSRDVVKSTLTSLAKEEAEFVSDIVVSSLEKLRENEIDFKTTFRFEPLEGGSVFDSFAYHGVGIYNELPHPNMPKVILSPKIALLSGELIVDGKSTFKFPVEIQMKKQDQLKLVQDEREKLLLGRLGTVLDFSTDVIVLEKGIDNAQLDFLSRKGLLVVRRVVIEDLFRLAKATGGRVVADKDDFDETCFGHAKKIEFRKVNQKPYLFVESEGKVISFFAMGPTREKSRLVEKQFEKALYAIQNFWKDGFAVPGGGAYELRLASELRKYLLKFEGTEQLAIQNVARSLEVVVECLARSSGLDPIDSIVKLRSHQSSWYGVDVYDSLIRDMSQSTCFDPLITKERSVLIALETASLLTNCDRLVEEKYDLERAKVRQVMKNKEKRLRSEKEYSAEKIVSENLS